MTVTSLALPANARPTRPTRWSWWTLVRTSVASLVTLNGCMHIAYGLAALAAGIMGATGVDQWGASGIVWGIICLSLGSAVRRNQPVLTRRRLALLLMLNGVGGLYMWVRADFKLDDWSLLAQSLAWIIVAPGVWLGHEWGRLGLFAVGLFLSAIQTTMAVFMLGAKFVDMRAVPLRFPFQLTMVVSTALIVMLTVYSVLPSTRRHFAEARESRD